MAPADVKLEIVLDQFEGKPIQHYFPGDEISGKIYFTSNQSCKLCNFRLVWTGGIQVQPIQTNRDVRTYFNECWKFKSITKSTVKKSNIYLTEMVGAHVATPEAKIELQKKKTIGLNFKVVVPNDQPLPSCTEAVALPNKIVYLLKAYLEENEKLYTQLYVPVYEYIFSRTPDMQQPRRAEQVYVVSNDRAEFTSAIRVTLPFRGSKPGTNLPISITLWNNMPFSRKQGISISLVRITEVIANGRAYVSQGEKVHRLVTDLNITTNDVEQNQKVQTLRIKFPIPKGISPSISFNSSQLMSQSYFIRVQAFAQEGVYTTLEGTRSQFMVLQVPVVICTKSVPRDDASPLSSPTLSFRGLPISNNNSGIFRSLSNGSGDSKMTAAFSTLRLYNPESDDQVSPVVVMIPKSEESQTLSSYHVHDNDTSLSRHGSDGSQGTRHVPVTLTDNVIDNHINDIIQGFSNKTSIEIEAPMKGESKVFQMFEDSDSEEDQFQKPHVKEEFVHKPNTLDSDEKPRKRNLIY